MKTYLESADINGIVEANEALIGTNDWAKYHMEWEFKNDKGRWIFGGYGVPHCDKQTWLKSVRDTLYIVQGNAFVTERYRVTESVKELLNI